MNQTTQRFAPISVLALGLLVSALGAFDATKVHAQARGEVIDPFAMEPNHTRSELLDPFADTPQTRRASGAPRTPDLLDPFATTARRVVHYLAELLDPWSD